MPDVPAHKAINRAKSPVDKWLARYNSLRDQMLKEMAVR